MFTKKVIFEYSNHRGINKIAREWTDHL